MTNKTMNKKSIITALIALLAVTEGSAIFGDIYG